MRYEVPTLLVLPIMFHLSLTLEDFAKNPQFGTLYINPCIPHTEGFPIVFNIFLNLKILVIRVGDRFHKWSNEGRGDQQRERVNKKGGVILRWVGSGVFR